MRLYNLLKNSLGLTRLELTEYMNKHKVTVNNIIVPLSTIINPNDIISIDGNKIEMIQFHYYLYYKPRGILSTISNKDTSYINQINIPFKVTPAGRLDKESEGLMVLSNDGNFLNKITGDKNEHEKEYIVKVSKSITIDFLNDMGKSYLMDGKMTKPAKVKKIDDYTFSIILFEGLYHQIRRLVQICNNNVVELKRIRISDYYLNDMKPGDIIEFKP